MKRNRQISLFSIQFSVSLKFNSILCNLLPADFVLQESDVVLCAAVANLTANLQSVQVFVTHQEPSPRGLQLRRRQGFPSCLQHEMLIKDFSWQDSCKLDAQNSSPMKLATVRGVSEGWYLHVQVCSEPESETSPAIL